MYIQERPGVLAAPRKVRSTFLFAWLRSAVPKGRGQFLLCTSQQERRGVPEREGETV